MSTSVQSNSGWTRTCSPVAAVLVNVVRVPLPGFHHPVVALFDSFLDGRSQIAVQSFRQDSRIFTHVIAVKIENRKILS